MKPKRMNAALWFACRSRRAPRRFKTAAERAAWRAGWLDCAVDAERAAMVTMSIQKLADMLLPLSGTVE